MKICISCQKSKTFRWHTGPVCHACYYKAYHKNKQVICIACGISSSNRWYKGPKCSKCRYNPEIRSQAHQQKREQNLEVQKLWRQKNPEKKRESDRKFRASNKDYIVNYLREWHKKYPLKRKSYSRGYTKRLKNAIPAWVDRKALSKIYDNCPPGYQVDHIIPIAGKTVSGLHVPWNLQYLTPKENQSKSNKLLQTYLNFETVNLSLSPIGDGK